MIATAFAPGHISGFFEPIYNNHDMLRSGSRGAGINISLGATTKVEIENSIHQSINIFLNGKRSNANVTRLAIKYLIENTPINININTKLDLPIGQGFGMSGAGALSSCLALSKLLNLSKENALKAAHMAEIKSNTGLGDILAASFGGIEIRREAGLPPWGMIEHIPGKYELTLCIIGSKIDTKKILTNPKIIQNISSYGRYCTKKILEKPSIENLFSLSQTFTKKIGLAEKKILDAINEANKYGISSMCMLGNSIFALGNTELLCQTLTNFGQVYICLVDEVGARLIETI